MLAVDLREMRPTHALDRVHHGTAGCRKNTVSYRGANRGTGGAPSQGTAPGGDGFRPGCRGERLAGYGSNGRDNGRNLELNHTKAENFKQGFPDCGSETGLGRDVPGILHLGPGLAVCRTLAA
jgi:hypothetical protein